MSHLPIHVPKSSLSLPFLCSLLFLHFSSPALSQKVGVNTESPQAGLHIQSNDGLLINGDFGSGLIPISGFGTRMLFNPKTGAFRSGRLTDANDSLYQTWWDFNNIGDYSAVLGLNSKASGFVSMAIGIQNEATGISAFVSGKDNVAGGSYSFAGGFGNNAPSFSEVVLGTWATQYTPDGITGSDPDDRLFVIGNGVGDGNSRHNALTLMKNGRLGINTETPQYMLDVAGDSRFANALVDNQFSASNLTLTTGAANGHILMSDASGNASWVAPATIFTDDWNSSAGNIYNTNTLNVGIGTSSPTAQLHVNGSVRLHNTRLSITGTGQSVFIGENAGANDDLSANNNVFIGFEAGRSNTSGGENIAIGTNALDDQQSGSHNIAIGREVLSDQLSAGNVNIGIGNFSLKENEYGVTNVAIGHNSMSENRTGELNVAIGHYALDASIHGDKNTTIGVESLSANPGSSNTAVGYKALGSAFGDNSVAIGMEAGLSAGSANVFVGHMAGRDETGDNKLYIDNSNTSAPLVYGEFDKNKLTVNDTLQVKYVNLTHGASNGHILVSNATGRGTWTAPSSVFSDEWNSNAGNIYNANTLNVGIGTSSPTAQLHVNGTVRFNNTRLSITGTGQSVFIGENAGQSDDLSNNNSVFIGQHAGKENTIGTNNIAIGAFALDQADNSNYNIALGESALGDSDMSGNLNIAIGNWSMENNESGYNNVAIGQNSLGQNTSGYKNVAMGIASMDVNTIGVHNTAAGAESLGNNTNGNFNVALGAHSLNWNVNGSNNTAIGTGAGFSALGSGNIFIGQEAGYLESGSNTLYIDNSGTTTPLIYGNFSTNKVTIHDSLQSAYFTMTHGAAANKVMLSTDNSGRGKWFDPYVLFQDTNTINLFIGQEVGQSVTTATDNTIIGAFAGIDLTEGYENTAMGKWALQHATTSSFNTAIGHNTLNGITTGNKNTALGWSALAGATGSSNVAVGQESGGENTMGSRNVYIGAESGTNNTGSDNIFIGYQAGRNEAGSNKLIIDNSPTATPLIAGNFTTNEVTINDSLTVNKELGVATSTPASTFEVNGSVAAKFKTPLAAGTDHPDGSGMVWRYNTGTGTINLPGAGTCPNRIYVIINQTGTTRTISTYRDLGTNNQTTISTSVALWLMSDGSQWWQIK